MVPALPACQLARFINHAGTIIPAIATQAAPQHWYDARPLALPNHDWQSSTMLTVLATLDTSQLAALPPLDVATLRPTLPYTGISKIVGVALNYAAHAAETNSQPPAEPVLFLKAPSALAGPTDPILLPPTATKLDYEVELGVVIGARARNISAQAAANYILGYVLANDVSERAFQKERVGVQHTKGKSYDSFCPIGPHLCLGKFPDSPVRLWTEVNGERRQDGTTAAMLFDVPTLVATISEFMSLEPGDLILTGTPPGVGAGMVPPQFLQVGDMVRLGGEHAALPLGTQQHQVIRAGDAPTA